MGVHVKRGSIEWDSNVCYIYIILLKGGDNDQAIIDWENNILLYQNNTSLTQGFLFDFFFWHLLWCIDVVIWLDTSKDKGARSIQPKFRPVRPGKEDHLKRWTCFFETFPVGPNRSIEFWTEISGNFGWMDRAQGLFYLVTMLRDSMR